MQLFKRTPEEAFQNIENFDYKTHYIANLVNTSSEYKDFRIAYIDENTQSKNGTLLFIHGHPTWSYLWRHLIPIALKQAAYILIGQFYENRQINVVGRSVGEINVSAKYLMDRYKIQRV